MHTNVEFHAEKINKIVEQAKNITEERHFDAERIAIQTAAMTDK